uniref:Aquaporin n=1 Tax=Gasterosteus aculeatus aculeatus TaxID=481459 RepID=G3PAN7_GASAC
MSGLNASLGYFLSAVVSAALVRALLGRWQRLGFVVELASSFALVACRLEVQTIVEVGEWAGGLGPDVTLTVLFLVLLTHGVVCGAASGNPSVAALRFLQLEASFPATLLAVGAQFLGAHLALRVAAYYWSLELTDMHMIKNLMAAECSTSLLVSLVQGFITECVCSLVLHLVHLNLGRRSALIRVPLTAVLLTFLSHIGSHEAYVSSLQPKATPLLTRTPRCLTASPSTAPGSASPSTRWSTGWAPSQACSWPCCCTRATSRGSLPRTFCMVRRRVSECRGATKARRRKSERNNTFFLKCI